MQIRIQLRWSDFDALRHLNNVSYVEFMQDARFKMLESLKLGAEHLVEVGHVVAHNEIDYLKPVGMQIRELKVSHAGRNESPKCRVQQTRNRHSVRRSRT